MSEGEVFVPQTQFQQAEFMVLQQMHDTLKGVSVTLTRQGEQMQTMREDIVWLRAREEQMAGLRETAVLLDKRLEAVELRNAQQDGAFKFAEFLKAYAPWLVTALVVVFGFLVKRQS